MSDITSLHSGCINKRIAAALIKYQEASDETFRVHCRIKTESVTSSNKWHGVDLVDS